MPKKRTSKNDEQAASQADDPPSPNDAEIAPQSDNVDVVSFEDALYRLADAVRQLEQGNLSLDESLAQYEDGIRHLSQCQRILETAERKIEVLSGFDADGNPITEDFDDENMSLEEKAEERSRRRSANSDSVSSAQGSTASGRRKRRDDGQTPHSPKKVKKKAKAKSSDSKTPKTPNRPIRKTVSSDANSDSNASVSFQEDVSQAVKLRNSQTDANSEENPDVDGNGTLF